MSNNNVSYANDKPPSTGEPEYANDPATGSFFSSDYKRHEDLKSMLDSNKDGLKLEAMKRIIGMVAKGKDASDLFPAVVKNVVSKNIEVKKLVYVYLVRYAEERQDLALLSISTFQRALKDPNQLIRASALRVLSSIRVSVIIPIMMLAIKDSVSDMSPYVRKTAAHAIPKLYSLDPELREQLIEVIEKLLSDKTTLVVGSAVMAFEEVCPERIDLIHKNYRKLCNLLVDVEEWGQVVILHMLTRYARTQFVDPNKEDGIEESERPFYEDDDDDKDDEPDRDKKQSYMMDQDHRLLLRNAKPLLQTRNTAVVMAVAQLYYYLAPRSEIHVVSKALNRLLRSYREVQSVVLSNIATMSTKRKGMFEPYLKSFFVRSSDATHIKLLKLEILTNLATETNVSVILREFQTYVASADKEFVAATIQAIGRCASSIKEVTDTCLNGLVNLMSNRSEAVVAESVVVIKKLLQMQPSEHKEIIVHMTRLADNITVPMARASILWLLGEYSDHVPKIAPDVLRKMAKTFVHEEDIVKLQILSLATKLYLTNAKQTELLCQYVLNLAKYDQNYDIRDRARFLRQLIFPSGDKENILAKHSKKIFLSTKPAPLLESAFKDRDQFQLGSLSHLLNIRCNDYNDLPGFPNVAPDPSVRNVEVPLPWSETKKRKQQSKKKSFYSETDSTSSDNDSAQSSSSSNSEMEEGSDEEHTSDDDSETSSSESSDDDTSESDSEDEKNSNVKVKKLNKEKDSQDTKASDDSNADHTSDSDETSSEESSSSDTDDSDSSKDAKKKEKVKDKPKPKQEKNVNLLLDLTDFDGPPPIAPAPNTLGQNILLPVHGVQGPVAMERKISPTIMPVHVAMYVPRKEQLLLSKIVSGGLHVTHRFTRNQNLYSDKMTSLELTFVNSGDNALSNIKIARKNIAVGMDMHPFPEIESLPVGGRILATLGIDFNETTQPANFDIGVGERIFSVSISAPVGELLQPIAISEVEFLAQQGKLKGLNENSIMVELSNACSNAKAVTACVYEIANVLQVQSTDPDTYLRFSAQTLATKSVVLLTVRWMDNKKAVITVNCEKIIVGSMLLKEVKMILSK